MEEKIYDRDELAQEVNVLKPKLNAGQRQIYNRVIEAAKEDQQALIFVYDHGGTGKTFLWKVLISSLRSKSKIVLVVASPAIPFATLKNTHAGVLLAETSLIIWDESPMNDRRFFETLDRTLKDIMDVPDKAFGVEGTSTIYKSSDEAIPIGNDRGEVELLYPRDYLNTLQLSGFPPYELELKISAPIMLLRNVNLRGDLYTMMQNCISDLKSGARNKVLEAKNSLYGMMACNFKKNEYDLMEKLVIIAVSSCKVSLYGDLPAMEPSLTSTQRVIGATNPALAVQQRHAYLMGQLQVNSPLNADILTGADCT
nr:DNA helicase [Tanacetum cinerariifolium]